MHSQTPTGEERRGTWGESSGRLIRIAIALVVPIAVVGEWYQRLQQPLRWRTALLIAVAGCAFSFLLRWRDLEPIRRRLLAVFVSTLLLSVCYELWIETGPVVYDVSRALVPVLLAWMCLLLLTSPDETAFIGLPPRLTSPALALGLGTLAIVATGMAKSFGGDSFHTIDEVLYLVQASRFADGAIVQPVEPSLLPFFLPYLALPLDTGFVPHFPPGWPALLSLFTIAGLRDWSGPILSAATVVAVFLLGKRLHSREAGVFGALSLVVHFWFIHQGASFHSHIATMLLLVGSALLLLGVHDEEKFVARALAAGFLLGWSVVARPLTGVMLGASVFFWSLMISQTSWRRSIRITALAAVGASFPLLALLAYNASVTGNPLQLGYSALHGSLHSLGFGVRGHVYYDSAMQRLPQTELFTPSMAFDFLGDRISDYAGKLWPSFMLVPLLAVTSVSGMGPRLRTVALFLLLPLVLFFWYDPVVRLYSELLPFIFVGVGVLVARLHEARRMALSAFLTLLLAQGLISTLELQRLYARERDGSTGIGVGFMDEVMRLHERRGRILVFVREPFGSEDWLGSLTYHNIDGYDSEIVVARDLGGDNVRLIRRFPGHTPFLLQREVKAGEPRLVELDRRITLRPDARRPARAQTTAATGVRVP